MLVVGVEMSKMPFSGFCDERLNDPLNLKKMELMSYLIMPVQRIPRYRLLLQEILKHTPEGSPDKEELETALAKIKEVAKACDQSIAVRETTEKLLELQTLFGEGVCIFAAGREFLMDAEMLRQCRKGMKTYHFWLFSVSSLTLSH